MEGQEIFGVRAILECIEAGQHIEKVWLLKGQKSPLFKTLENRLREAVIAHSYVPKERLDRFNTKNHQGAVALISPIAFYDLEPLIEKSLEQHKPPLFLLLDQITDTRNLGAILRNASACGVDALILPQSGSARITADTIKTSAGAAFTVPIVKVEHLKDAVFLLEAYEIQCMALTEKATLTVYEHEMNRPMALILGSEEKGISKSLLNMVKLQAKLPMIGDIASLNVAVACGAILYEVIRQRNFQ